MRERECDDVWTTCLRCGFPFSHRAAAGVDESLSCRLAAHSPLIIKCSSRSSDLIHAGPSNLLLSTRHGCTELPSYPRISFPCILSDELQCVYIFNFFFLPISNFAITAPRIHPAVTPVLMSLPGHASSSYISFQSLSTADLNNGGIL